MEFLPRCDPGCSIGGAVMPSYLDRTLQPSEIVLHRTRLHWVVYLSGVATLLFGLTMWALSNELYSTAIASKLFYKAVGGVFCLLGLVSLAAALIQRISTEMAITSTRVLVKRGLILRKTVEMSRSKVETVEVKQGIAGRMLDFGTVVVRGTGGGLEPLRNVDSPLEVRRHILA